MRKNMWLVVALMASFILGAAYLGSQLLFSTSENRDTSTIGVSQEESRKDEEAVKPTSVDIRLDEIIYVLPKDAIPALTNPEFGSALQTLWQENELILGVTINGDARAYPIAVLNWHEIVNDIVGGVPVAVTFCPLCGTGLVFESTVDQQVLVFKVSGRLYKNDLVMYDTATESYWSQVLGTAIWGPLKGKSLKILPASTTTLKEWMTLYPESRVLDAPAGSFRDYTYNPYQDYLTSNYTLFPRYYKDDTLHPKAHVIGVTLSGESRAYPFSLLSEKRFVNDVLGGVEIVVAFDPETSIAKVYGRRLGDMVLFFDRAEGLFIHDKDTGSRWSIVEGKALEGAYLGKGLKEVQAITGFWFAWKDFYPQTTIYVARS